MGPTARQLHMSLFRAYETGVIQQFIAQLLLQETGFVVDCPTGLRLGALIRIGEASCGLVHPAFHAWL